MNLKINNSHNIVAPQNHGDAGYDIIAASQPKIIGDLWMANLYKNVSYIEYDTAVEFDFQDAWGEYEFYANVFPRSSVSKYNLLLCNSVGVIDSGYKNSIKLRFKYIYQPEDIHTIKNDDGALVSLTNINKEKIYKKGDKIGQVIFSKHNLIEIEGIDDNKKRTKRNMGGFGSTGS